MISWMIERKITRLEREFDYDASYLREVLGTSSEAALRFALAAGALGAYRAGIPPEVRYAAVIRAAMRADCGPCVQLVVRFAEREGVESSILSALAMDRVEALPEEVALAARFADAVLSRAPELEALREAIEARYGTRGLIDLAYGVLTSQLYPTLKYALGHGSACVALEVGGERLSPARPEGLDRGADPKLEEAPAIGEAGE